MIKGDRRSECVIESVNRFEETSRAGYLKQVCRPSLRFLLRHARPRGSHARSAPWRVIDPIAVRFACGGTVAERAGSESERDAAAQLSRGDASWRADMGHVEDMRRQ